MVKIFALFAILAFAAAIPSDQVSPEDDLVQVGVTAAEDAKATVDALMKSGKDQGACADLAASTIKEVEDAVDAQQKVLDSLDTGADCSKRGQGPVDAANKAIADAQKAKSDADSAFAAAQAAPVQFADAPLDTLTEGQCTVFFEDAAYLAAKQAMEAAQKDVQEAAGAVTAAKNALKAAQDQQARDIERCHCNVKKAFEKAWEAANTNNDADKKAYTKGKHMECVLAGTPPADCQVGNVPVVTKPNMNADTVAVDTQGENCKRHPTTVQLQLTGATQSSEGWNGHANRAVDGNTSGDYNQHSCTHTTQTNNKQWWRANFEQKSAVEKVEVWNRVDCCSNRLNGVQVRVAEHGGGGHVCGKLGSGATSEVECNESPADYLVVEGQTDHLTICELKAFGYAVSSPAPPPEDLLKITGATQSSEGWNGHANRAVDGNTSGDYNQHSCTHTTHTNNKQWWRGNFEQKSSVNKVEVWNRVDCCSNRLNGIQVRVAMGTQGPDQANHVCGKLGSGATSTVSCGGAPADHIVVEGHTDHLTICELKAHGHAI